MSGVLIYSEKEAKRNTFAINKFKEELGVTLAINDYDGTADFIINRTNNYKIAEKFEKKGIRVFNPSSLSKLANNKQLCYEFMEKNGIEILPINHASPACCFKNVHRKNSNRICVPQKYPSIQSSA